MVVEEAGRGESGRAGIALRGEEGGPRAAPGRIRGSAKVPRGSVQGRGGQKARQAKRRREGRCCGFEAQAAG